MKKPVPTFSEKNFIWEPLEKRATVFASDLGYRAGEIPGGSYSPPFSGHGFWVEGKSRSCPFFLTEEKKSDGETHWWEYKTGNHEFTIRVYND